VTRAEAAVLAARAGRRADNGGDIRRLVVVETGRFKFRVIGMGSSMILISDLSSENSGRSWAWRGLEVGAALTTGAGETGRALARATGLGWFDMGFLRR
jgi:hypothetical protein